MRRLAVLLVAPAVLLTGCSGKGSSSAHDTSPKPLPVPAVSVSRAPIPTIVASDAVLPRVTGKFGVKASIAIPKGKPSGRFVVAAERKGEGPVARRGDMVAVKYAAKIWKSGKALPSSYDKGASPQVFPVGQGRVIPALDRAVQGQRAGSRVLVVAPPAAAYGSTGNDRLGVAGTDTVVFAVDIERVIGAKAMLKGEQLSVADDLPQVSVERQGAATITVPDGDAPGRLVSKVLIEGSGPVVKGGRTVVVQYSGAVWQDNRGEDRATLFDSSWAQGGPLSTVIGRGNVIEGWDRGLVGKKAGSRVLLVVPPGQGYGTAARKGIPAGSTLVFVIDILAAV